MAAGLTPLAGSWAATSVAPSATRPTSTASTASNRHGGRAQSQAIFPVRRGASSKATSTATDPWPAVSRIFVWDSVLSPGPVPEDAAGWRLELDEGPTIDDVGDVAGGDRIPRRGRISCRWQATPDQPRRLRWPARRGGGTRSCCSIPIALADGLVIMAGDGASDHRGIGLPDDAFAESAGLETMAGDHPMIVAGCAFLNEPVSHVGAGQRITPAPACGPVAMLFERYDVVLAPVMPSAAFPTRYGPTDHRPRPSTSIGAAVPHLIAMAWCGAIGSVLLPVVTLPTGPTPDGPARGRAGHWALPLRHAPASMAAVLDAAAGPEAHAAARSMERDERRCRRSEQGRDLSRRSPRTPWFRRSRIPRSPWPPRRHSARHRAESPPAA